MWKPALISLLVFILVSLTPISIAFSEEKSFCQDPEDEAEWEELLQKKPGNRDLNVLHPLRIGLCEKIDRGQLTVREATIMFESARLAMVKDIKSRQEKQGKEGEL